ncbi:MAG: DUF134 domain-containing protein [Saccharofermentanales bacterium]
MARPIKWRRISYKPTALRFSPTDIGVIKGFNTLKFEEIEAIRLKDLEGLEQIECASEMGVSRPTFQRILLSAREKIADSLINGKEIRIEGGNYTRGICPLCCLECGREWDQSMESMESLDDNSASALKCPRCHSEQYKCSSSRQEQQCRHRCRHRGQTRNSVK